MKTVTSNGITRVIKSRKESIERQSLFLSEIVHGINLSLHEDEIPLKLIVVPYEGDENFMHLTEDDKKATLEIRENLQKSQVNKRFKIFMPRLLTEENMN